VKPLEDVRILAVEQYGAGPFGTLHLADLGAEVIKVEDPSVGGDVGRYTPPYSTDEDSLFFEAFNRNKRSISLDLAHAQGRQVFEDLVRVSDVVYSNLRGDVPARMRIRYEDLKHLNERIVCCSLTGFGMTGPRASEPGYDYILQGLAGWMSVTGEPGGPPTKAGLSLVDYSGGFVGGMAVLAGVHAARRDGRGMDCDLSLYDTSLSLLTYLASWHLNAGYEPERTRRSAHPSLVPFQLFQAEDAWIVVGCAKQKFWLRLLDVVQRPDLAQDPRFSDLGQRHEHRDELLEILEPMFTTRAAADWLHDLRAASIPCGPVHSVAEALADEHTAARNMVVTTEHPRYGQVRQVASPLKVGDLPVEHRRAPRRGEDTHGLLRELLAYDDQRLADLTATGTFG